MAKHFLFLITAPGHVADVRPVVDVREVDTRLGNQIDQNWNVVLLARRAQSIHHEEVLPAVVIEIAELGGPAPERLAGAGFFGEIGERAVAIVVPQHVAFFHVFVGDVGDVDIEPTVVVVVGDIDVHALLGVVADGLFGYLAESAVAIVEVHAVSAVVAGQIDVLQAIVIEIAMADIEGPTGVVGKSGLGSDLDEVAFAVALPKRDAAAITGVVEVVGEPVVGFAIEQVIVLAVFTANPIILPLF